MSSEKRVEKMRRILREEAKPALWYALEKNPKLASEIVSNLFELILDIITEMNQNLGYRIDEVNQKLGKRIDEVAARIDEVNQKLGKRIDEVAARIDEVNQKLGKRIDEVAASVDKVSRTVDTLAFTVGKLDRRYAKLLEIELRETLERLCFSSGFKVDRGVIEPGKPSVDAIIKGKELVSLVEIAMKGGSRDLYQLLRTSEVYEGIYGVKPSVLFLLSVEEPDKLTFERAKEKGIIVTMRPGKIVEILEKMVGN